MDFLSQIISLTGLPKNLVEKELFNIMESKGLSAANLTDADIREILATYMQETLLNLKKEIET